MIFVTVGTQLAFDRLIGSVDTWAGQNPDTEIFAQIGPSTATPQNIQFADFLPPDKSNEMFQKASLIVSHAGMGSILTSLKYKKPILIMPRRASLGEHRNEHQLATAKRLGERSGIHVAWDEEELVSMLNNLQKLDAGEPISDYASDALIANLKNFINAV